MVLCLTILVGKHYRDIQAFKTEWHGFDVHPKLPTQDWACNRDGFLQVFPGD